MLGGHSTICWEHRGAQDGGAAVADDMDRDPRDGLQTIVDDLAEELGRSVVINDPIVRVLCTSRHFGDEDAVRVRAILQRDAGPEAARYLLELGVTRWSRAGTVPARPDLGMNARLCVPLRDRAELLGLLLVIDADHTLTPQEIARIEEVSKSAAALLVQRRAAADKARAERDRELLRLLDGETEERRQAVRAGTAAGWMIDAPQVVVTVVEARRSAASRAEVDIALRTILEPAARRQQRRSLTVMRDGRGTMIEAAGRVNVSEAIARAQRMVVGLGQMVGGDGAAGVGGVVPGLAEAWRSHAQAITAMKGAGLIPGFGPVVDWGSLGAYAILLQLPDDAFGPALRPEPVARLLQHEKASRLVETLRTYLDYGGSVPRTAEALHLHRTSLYYRLEQVRDITGLDIDDGRNRLLLHLSLLLEDIRSPTAPSPRT
jgi:sugar diacid utilization regulator